MNPGSASPAIETAELTRRFRTRRERDVEALRGVDLRRRLLGRVAIIDHGKILAAATVVGGYFWFAWCERTARAKGLIDWKSNY